jgi:hypothetical protein
VVGASPDVRAVARATALRLGAGGSSGVGVLGTCSAAPGAPGDRPGTPGVRVPARPAAARLAAALAGPGLPARAAGRLVEVQLAAGGPGSEPRADAQAEAGRGRADTGAGPATGADASPVAAAELLGDRCPAVPLVLAVGGARDAVWDRLLPRQDLILLAVGPQVPEAVTAVALAGIGRMAPGVAVATVAVRGGRRRRPARDQLAAALAVLEPR